MKKLMALALTAALTLTSAVVVFAAADEYDYDYYGYGYEEYEEAIAVVEHVPFTGTARLFTGGWGTILGYIPTFPGNAALNQRIEHVISVTYYSFLQVDTVSRPRPAGQDVLSFTLEETLTAARVEIFMLNDDLVDVSIMTIYVDKTNNSEITAEAFAASAELVGPAEAEEAVEGEEAAEEIEIPVFFMSPIRINAEAAGFTVNWSPDGAVIAYDENLALNILTGSTAATLVEGEEETAITLDAAPVNNGGVVYVPSTLLIDVLGIQFELLTSDAVVATPAEEAVEVEEYEAEEYEVEVVEVPFEERVAELEAAFIAELYDEESIELTIVEGYELLLVVHSDDELLIEDLGAGFSQDVRDGLGLESLVLTIRIVALDGTVVFEETFEV